MENENKEIDNSISTVIQDNSGGLSSSRVLMLSWGFGVLVAWITISIIGAFHGKYEFSSIPESVVTILLGLTGFKTVQRFGEK